MIYVLYFYKYKETFKNFYKFLALYNYIKYFIYNNDNNYIKKIIFYKYK